MVDNWDDDERSTAPYRPWDKAQMTDRNTQDWPPQKTFVELLKEYAQESDKPHAYSESDYDDEERPPSPVQVPLDDDDVCEEVECEGAAPEETEECNAEVVENAMYKNFAYS